MNSAKNLQLAYSLQGTIDFFHVATAALSPTYLASVMKNLQEIGSFELNKKQGRLILEFRIDNKVERENNRITRKRNIRLDKMYSFQTASSSNGATRKNLKGIWIYFTCEII